MAMALQALCWYKTQNLSRAIESYLSASEASRKSKGEENLEDAEYQWRLEVARVTESLVQLRWRSFHA